VARAGDVARDQELGLAYERPPISATTIWLERVARFLAPALVGAAAAVGGIQLGGVSNKRVVIAFSALAILVIALASRHARRVFLFCWIVCLTYNRNYFIEALGNNASYGLYWSPADVFLVLLFLHWAWDLAIKKRLLRPLGSNVIPWMLPFAFACLLSIVGADRMDWGFYEMARLLRIALILLYVRYNVRREEWLVCAVAFGATILIQSSMGIPYVLTGQRIGLASLLGTEQQLSAVKQVLDDSGAGGGLRAEGTLGHPNIFAVYLLLTGPLFLSLAAVAPLRRGVRAACAAIGLLALASIGVTLSRTSWAIISAQLLVLAVGFPALGLVRARRVIGATIVVASLGVACMMPFSGAIQRRFENFGDMIDYRSRHDRIAIEIWKEHPLFGIGLNEYSATLSTYDLPEIHVYNMLAEYVRKGIDIRVTAWVHNIYLLVLAETGAIGFASFLIFMVGALWIGVRAVAASRGAWRAASFGLLVGIVGLDVHGLQEAALWVDPITYTFALVVGLLALVPALARELPESRRRAATEV